MIFTAHQQRSAADRDLTTSRYWSEQWRGSCGSVRAPAARSRPHPLIPLLATLSDRHSSVPADVLEIGCAPGTILSQLAAQRPRHRYHGIDFSQPGLDETARLLARQSVRAELHFGDAREFEPLRKFGLVYSCGLIEHFTNPVALVRHHVRLCALGGFVCVSVPNYSGRVQEWFINRLDPAALESHNLRIMTVEALRGALEDAGLVGIESGCVGPALIRSRCVKRSLAPTVLRRVAQAWNLASSLTPTFAPWRSVLWAYGRTV